MTANPDSLWIIVDGVEKGPYARHELTEMQLSGDTLCAKEGDPTWRPLKEVTAAPATHKSIFPSVRSVIVVVAVIVGIFFIATHDPNRAAIQRYVDQTVIGPHKLHSIQLIQREGDTYIYSVTVDGLNGFGGPARTTFPLTLKGGFIQPQPLQVPH